MEQFTSHLDFLLTKKRFNMLIREFSLLRSGTKTALLLPVLGLLALTFSTQETGHIRILDEIPRDILRVENLTVFPGDTEPLYTMELIREQTFGETGGPDLGTVTQSVVDETGRVIVLDIPSGTGYPPPYRLHVYNPDGTYHTQISGPDELGSFVYLVGTAAGTAVGNVYVVDSFNDRLNVYNTDDYTFERSEPWEQWSILNHEAVEGFEFGGLQARNDGNLIVYFNEMGPVSGRRVTKVMLMDTDGNALNYQPLVISTGSSVRFDADPPTLSLDWLFRGSAESAMSDEGVLYTAWSENFLIRKYNADGTYQSAIYYPVEGSLIDLDDYTERFRFTKDAVDNALENGEELPEPTPVLARLISDDENRIWAAVRLDLPTENYEWWVLDESGELLAKLERPRDPQILEIKNGYLYSKERDEETLSEVVVKYRIELTPSATAD